MWRDLQGDELQPHARSLVHSNAVALDTIEQHGRNVHPQRPEWPSQLGEAVPNNSAELFPSRK